MHKLNLMSKNILKILGPTGRAATFTRVNGTVSCFCNKRLQNWPTFYTNVST